MGRRRTYLLVVMDGFGLNPIREGNAVALAKTPHFDFFWQRFRHAQLEAFGEAVGLSDGQMGGSEVGHLNLGAGRVVLQDMKHIDSLIESGEFAANAALKDAMSNVRRNGSRLHVMGLLSPGGVHSSVGHLCALLDLAASEQIRDVFLHAFLDGRDVLPRSAKAFIEDVEELFPPRPPRNQNSYQ
jgi:2,3-bisphosphoglycerate-independent phosphoglycerate mutase